MRAELHLGARLLENILGHAAGRHGLQRTARVQIIRQFGDVVARDLVLRDLVRHLDHLVIAVVEPSDRDGCGRNPVTDLEVILAGF
jgi:hypothetical protein